MAMDSISTLYATFDVGSLAGTGESSQQTLPKEIKRTHTLSFQRHRASMNVETEYIINDQGKQFLQKHENIKESDIPTKSTTNTFLFDKLVKAANQNCHAGKIVLWQNTLRLQISFMVSYPSRKELKTLSACDIHSSGLPIIVSDFIKTVRINPNIDFNKRIHSDHFVFYSMVRKLEFIALK